MTALVDGLPYLVASFGLSTVINSTLALLVTLVAVRLARHSSASVRHRLLTAGFGVLLALPLASLVARAVDIEIAPVSSTLEEYMSESVLVDGLTPTRTPTSRTTAQQWSFATAEFVAAAWATGSLLFTFPVLAGVVQVRRLRRTGLPWRAGQKVVDSLTREAGVRTPVDVLLHDCIAAPATCGVRRHMILFPADASTWSHEDIRRAAIHEVEHVRRGDCFINALIRVICAVYWFHPLVWIAWRRLGLEAEHASDDAVLRGADATVYADQLVALAGRLPARTRHPLLAMANRSHLVRRVTAVLNQRQARGHVGTKLTAAIRLAAFSVVATIAPIQTRGQTVSEDRLAGLWDMQRTAGGDSVVLRLCYAELFSRSELPVEQVNWWPVSPTAVPEQVGFALRREAGTFTFEGIVAQDAAQGTFTFGHSTRFEAELRRRGYQSLTPSQYLALAQHDIDLAALDEGATERAGGAHALRMIREA